MIDTSFLSVTAVQFLWQLLTFRLCCLDMLKSVQQDPGYNLDLPDSAKNCLDLS